MKKSKKQAFTLIELLVVVLIIGILAAVAVPQYQKAVEKSHLAEALLNIETVVKNVDLYVLEKGTDYYGQHENWTTDLSGGEWSEMLTYYTTKNFVYDLRDGSGVEVYRCSGVCTGDADTDESNAIYELWQDYNKPINDNPKKACTGFNAVGKSICKSLVAQGWEDLSEE